MEDEGERRERREGGREEDVHGTSNSSRSGMSKEAIMRL